MPIDEKVTKETMDLFTAAEKGDTRKIASLLDDENTNVNWRNQPKGGATALHAAVSKGRDKAAALLIERGAHMHIKTNVDLNTPLHVCCQNGNLTLIKLLVSKGAEINLENQFGNTPVHAACLKGDLACVSFLLDNGSTVDSVNHLKSTPLHFACYNDKQNLELVKYLMSRGASITAEDSEGAIPLQVAATKGHAKICTVLVDAGSDPNHYDAQGRTAVSLALARGHMSLAQALGGSGLTSGSGLQKSAGKGLHLAQQAAARKSVGSDGGMTMKPAQPPASASDGVSPKQPEKPQKKRGGGFFRRRK